MHCYTLLMIRYLFVGVLHQNVLFVIIEKARVNYATTAILVTGYSTKLQ